MKKCRIFRLLLALCLLLAALTVPVLATEPTEATEPPETSGSCGENMFWDFQDGTLYISGTGDMKDYSIMFPGPWAHLRESITAVVIGDGITGIGDYAFSFCEQVRQVTIGSGVTDIGKDAFGFCEALESLTIPANVQTIDIAAFEHCKQMKTLTIESGVPMIGAGAFVGCISLEEVTIPDSVIELGARAFERCEKLRSVTLSTSLTAIQEQTFMNCTALERIEIPANVTEVKESAFKYCESLTSAWLGQNVTAIGEDAFYHCESLKDVRLSKTLKSIGPWAFQKCTALESVVFPPSLETIGAYAFSSCKSLKNLTLNDGLTLIDTAAFQNCEALEKLKIPDSVTELGNNAFYECKGLKDVTLSASLTEIKKGTFYCCEAMDGISIPDSVTTIGNTAFYRCKSLFSISFGKGVETIGYQAFTRAGDNLDSPCWLLFSGDAPRIDEKAFISVKGWGQYYGLNPTWTEDVLLDYGGEITWEPSYSKAFIAMLTMDELHESYIRVIPYDSREGVSSGKQLNGVTIHSVEGTRELGIDRLISNNSAGVDGVTLSKEGYRDYVVPAVVAAGMHGTGGKAYDLTAVMTKFTLFNKNAPYVSTVFGRNHGTGEAYAELRSARMVASPSVTQDVVISVGGFGGEEVLYCLGTRGGSGSPIYLTSKTGVFTNESLYSLLNDENIVYAWAQSLDTGKQTDPVAIRMTRAAANTDLEQMLDSGEFSLLGEDGLKITLGDNVPLFGGVEIDLTDFEAPIGIQRTANTLRISLGIDLFDNGDSKQKSDYKWKSFKKAANETAKKNGDDKKETGNYDRYQKMMASFCDNNGLDFKPDSIGYKDDFDFSVGTMGYAEYQQINGQWILTEGVLGVNGAFSVAYDVQSYVGWVPVYGTVEGGAEIEAAGEATRGVPDRDAPFRFDVKVDLTPEVTVGAGVGINDAATGGLYGTGRLPVGLEIGEQHLTIKAQGEIGAKAELFGTETTKVLLESKEITLLDKYFGIDSRMAALRPIAGQVVTTVMDRDYAAGTSEWLGDPDKLTATMSDHSAAARGMSFRDLQTSIFSNARPQLVSVGDGMVLVWSEDDSGRDSFNRMRLVYSVYDPDQDTWSDPAPVWDDGCNDGYAKMVSDGENVWLLWQKVNTVLTKDTAVDLAYMQAHTELCLARFDAEAGAFRDQQMITSNEVYEYAHTIDVRDGTADVLWASAADNALNEASAHSVTAWRGGQTQTLARGVNYVLSIAADDGEVTYLADTDGDLSTTADVTAFTMTEGTTAVYDNSQSGKAVTFAAYAPLDGEQTLFISDLNTVHYRRDGQWQTVPGIAGAVLTDLQIVPTPQGTVLLWTQSEEGWNELYSTRFCDGAWTAPVRISDNGQILSHVSAVCHDGRLAGVCNANSVTLNTETGKYEAGTTDLRFFRANDFADLVLENALPLEEGGLERGADAALYMAVYNRGTTDVEQITFTVSDTLGTQSVQTMPVALRSGESRVVKLTYPVPDTYDAATLTISAGTAAEDIDPSDNVVSMAIGRSDLSVSESAVEVLEGGYLVKAVVENGSLVDAENVTLEISAGTAAWVEYIGSIGRADYALVSVMIPEEGLTFDENETAEVRLTLHSDSEESAGNDNTLCVLVEKAAPLPEEPEEVVTELASGWTGACQWKLTSDGILTVYGSGNMKNYGWEGNQPWAAYAEKITSVVIEEGVAQIGSGAFKDMTSIESVTLPDSGLSKIGIAAFYGCTSLKEIYIPEGIYTIWEYTFKNCTAMENVRLPKTLIKIDQGAFEACTALTELFLSTNVEIIGGWSFKGCTAMASVDMQWADATMIRPGAFKNCTALTKIILPGNIRTLGDSCFYGIGATSFVVPETVTEIQDWCFARSSLAEITFAGDAPAIGTGAFNKIALTAWYDGSNATWTSDIMQNYGGTVTWKAN